MAKKNTNLQSKGNDKKEKTEEQNQEPKSEKNIHKSHAKKKRERKEAQKKARLNEKQPKVEKIPKKVKISKTIGDAYAFVFPSKQEDGYTEEQDKEHVKIVVGVIIAILTVALIAIIATAAYTFDKHRHELVIPAASFTSAQVQNVEDALTSMGFVDITYNKDTGMTAHGTQSMVDAYCQSYYDQYVAEYDQEFSSGIVNDDIMGISIDPVENKIKISTFINISSSTLMSAILCTTDIEDPLRAAATWCSMKNGGEKPTFEFTQIGEETPYLSLQASSANEVVALMQKQENEDTQEQQSTDTTTEEDITG